ncbi:MAG: sigma 54-interacting transcriptional regulator [Desulfobacterales bacterium]|nr:sigma 54-interacting transcriptional regulator [Desulfobacterales bacterium]
MKTVFSDEQILDNATQGIIATDKKGRIVFLNDRAAGIIGLSKSEITGADFSGFLPATGVFLEMSLKTGTAVQSQFVKGKAHDLVVSIKLIKHDGKVRGSVCSLEELKNLEAVAKAFDTYNALYRQLKAVFDASPDGIWVCDGDGIVLNVNPASEKFLGINCYEMIGKNMKDLVAQGVIDRSATIEALSSKRQVNIMQYVAKVKKHLLLTGTPVFNDAGNVEMVVAHERDITRLNSLMKELEVSRSVTEKYKDELAELSMLELKRQEVVAESDKMRQVLRFALKLGNLESSNIMILGESGTGKGLLSKFIHKNSKRKKKPFIQINCAALPETLLEAELFGYEKGAFTGARQQGKVGLFELAQGGTLFLDEIGDLPLSVQAKLLTYLDDHEIMHLGGLKSIKIDCIVIAATNRDLETLVKQKKFRQDLYYRLNTFMIKIPPLRERREDIFELASFSLKKYNQEYKFTKRLSPRALEALQSYPFPGNVRELKSVMKKAVVMSESDLLDEFILNQLGGSTDGWADTVKNKSHAGDLNRKLDEVEMEILKSAATHCKSTRQMARFLGISQPSVVRKLKKHKLKIK